MSRLLSSTAIRDESVHAHIPASLWEAANRWWAGYTSWRLHKAAIAQLRSMSDRQLADIGVSRSEIEFAVRLRHHLSSSHAAPFRRYLTTW